MPAEALAQVLRPLSDMFPPEQYPDLVVGLGAVDDAAVYRLNDEQALIQTLDFFTPIVDTPYEFGAIAAANALSDIYAMGGEVLFALNVAAFPPDLPPLMLAEILRGGADVVRSVGAAIAGGHTIRDKEPKYGLAVTGMGHPDRLFTKGGARPGDQLVLTKPLGTGTITTALKRGHAAPEHVDAAVASMTRLNRVASQAARAAGVHSATDITGFGLIGHSLEMAGAAQVRFRLRFADLPWLPGALHYAEAWLFPGGAHDNQAFYNASVTYSRPVAGWQETLLHDPQTSGGLLLAVSPEYLPTFVEFCTTHNQPFWLVGDVAPGAGIEIV
jgi:selenide, water dikinase